MAVLKVMGRFVRGLALWQRGTVAAIVNACAWTLLYFLFLRMPLPAGWTVRSASLACLAAGVMGGACACVTSRRLWPVALGAATGIILGGAEAVFSDVTISYWRRVTGGLVMAPLPLYLWLCIIASWVAVSLTLGRWQFPRKVVSAMSTRRASRIET
jgi:hypothetical protein